MIINRLSISGFKIMGSQIELEFPEEGKIGIIGPNESGKSTIMEAIAFVLYGLKGGRSQASEQRENLVTWGKAKTQVRIEFSSGDYRYILDREIGLNSGHKASLTILRADEQVGVETNIGQIEERIERAIGMDRDSFTKLVYIRQKDLDTLKELGKARREQLVNKVMGMEVFDTATSTVKKDLQDLRQKRAVEGKDLELAKGDKDRYEENLERKTKLENDLAKQKTRKSKLGEDREKKKERLRRYDWLSEKTSLDRLLKEKKRHLEGIKRQAKELAGINERVGNHTRILAEQEPDFKRLESMHEEFQDYDQQLSTQKSQLEDVKGQRSRELRSVQLSEDELRLLTPGLQRKKQMRMWGFLVSLIGGVVSLFAGVSVSPIFYFLTAIFFAIFAFALRSYLGLEAIASKTSTLQSLDGEIKRRERELEGLGSKYEEAKKTEGYNSLVEVEKVRKELIGTLKKHTGYESIEALRTAISLDIENRGKLQSETAEMDTASEEMEQVKKQLDAIMQSKPEGVEGIRYSRQAHERVKEQKEEAERKFSDIESSVGACNAKIEEIDRILESAKAGYERYPSLKEEVDRLDRRIGLLDRVIVELGETSKGIRDRVLPYAAYMINQILPDITDGRYSDLQISEDLQFKVHSMEAGDYKERDVFSGGTQDQFLIALRLAFTQSILDSRVQADRYCLLMDECTSSSDEARKQAIFGVLEKVKNTFPQIFIIAHEDVSNLVDHHIVLSRDENGYTQILSKSW